MFVSQLKIGVEVWRYGSAEVIVSCPTSKPPYSHTSIPPLLQRRCPKVYSEARAPDRYGFIFGSVQAGGNIVVLVAFVAFEFAKVYKPCRLYSSIVPHVGSGDHVDMDIRAVRSFETGQPQ